MEWDKVRTGMRMDNRQRMGDGNTDYDEPQPPLLQRITTVELEDDDANEEQPCKDEDELNEQTLEKLDLKERTVVVVVEMDVLMIEE